MGEESTDYFFIDNLNMVGGHNNILKETNGSSKAIKNTSNTVRLYTTNSTAADVNSGLGTLEWLILTAPYIDPIGISGRNSFEVGQVDPFTEIFDHGIEMWQKGRQAHRSGTMAIDRAVDRLKNLFNKDSYSFNRAGILNDNVFQDIKNRPSDIKNGSPSEVTKSYVNTSIDLPIETISATYLSNPAESWAKTGFSWLGDGSEKLKTHVDTSSNGRSVTIDVDGNKPLKTMAKYLCRVLLGQIGSDTSGGVIVYDAPNGYSSFPGVQSSFGKNALILCVGNGLIITNLIPTALSINPSRYLTITGDFYSMDVSVSLDISRYILSDELDAWIDNAGFDPANRKATGRHMSVGTTTEAQRAQSGEANEAIQVEYTQEI